MLISKEKNLIQIGEQIDIRFDSSIEKNSPLYFEPERKKLSVNIGENSLAFYKAVNKTDREITTMSVFNVTPHQAAKYFNKIECFCFSQQEINGLETKELPLQFIIDDNLPFDTKTLILSYTMFNTTDQMGSNLEK